MIEWTPEMERIWSFVVDAARRPVNMDGSRSPNQSAILAADAHMKALEDGLSDACKLIDAALGDGPDCDCQPEGHVCGWPRWKVEARRFLDAAIAALKKEG